jgi:hypothetical protein
MSDVEETYLEGMWDCPNCESANKGSQMKCEGCGSVRAEDVKFYLPEDAKEITDEAELNAAKAGPDWVCGFCDTSNSAGQGSCKQCGGPREEGKNREVSEYKPPSATEDPYASPDSQAPSAPKAGAGLPVSMPVLAGIGVAFLALMCCCLWMVFGSSTKAMEVVSTQWVRQIDLQEQRWVKEESKTRPFNGNNIRYITSRKVSRMVSFTKKVPVKKTKKINLGNGKFKRQTTTVMENKTVKEKRIVLRYFYEQRKWVNLTPLVKRGNPDVEPTWPERKIMSRNQRESKRETYYVVTFKDLKDEKADLQKLSSQGGKTKIAPQNMEELKSKYPVGSSWKVTFSTASGVTEVKKP